MSRRPAITIPREGAFSFDADAHVYRLGETLIPSVTQGLQLAGVTPNVWRSPAQARLAGERGTHVHLACEYLDRGTLDWSDLDPLLEPYVRAYEAFKADTRFLPGLIEQTGYGVVAIGGERLPFGYTLDRAGIWRGRDGMGPVRPLLLDLKTGSEIKPAIGVQLAGYEIGVTDPELRGEPRDRVAVQLRPDPKAGPGTKPYRIYEYPDETRTFEAALWLAWWHLRQGHPLPSGIDEVE